jgi:hypothetical protein
MHAKFTSSCNCHLAFFWLLQEAVFLGKGLFSNNKFEDPKIVLDPFDANLFPEKQD